jgi:type II secretory pathway pseudopilin PulG
MINSELRSRPGERGFTLAAVLVILTVMLVFIAFTIPRMWSDVLKRERDYQTIWAMKQYARAIKGYNDARQVYPTKLDDLKQQNRPRVLRQLYPNPLSGKMDWVLVPFGTPTGDQIGPINPQSPNPQSPNPQAQIPPSPNAPAAPGANGGPFIGVRPPQTGKSFLLFRGKETYKEWIYTTNELEQDILANVGQVPAASVVPTTQTKP